MSSRERALRLVDAYRGAVACRFGRQKASAFRRGDVTRSKHFKTLLDAAEFMIAHELAPAAWAAWSCDKWRAFSTTKTPPPVAWVFGVKRLAERRGWFEAEEDGYLGGTVKVGPKKHELMHRYMTMRFAIHNARAWANPTPYVDHFFPGASFDLLVAAAKTEATKLQEQLRSEADTGSFLW